MKAKTFLPCFAGFYETVLTPDYIFEQEVDEYDCFTWDDFDNKKYEIAVSKKHCNTVEKLINSELGLNCKITFESLYNPREYNFSTDSINISIDYSKRKLDRLIKEHYDELSKIVKEKYTSRSGSWSSHSAYFNDWLNKSDLEYYGNSEYKLGAILEMLFGIATDRNANDITAEEIMSNDCLDNYITIGG